MKKKGITAAELMTRLQNDPTYQVEREREEQEREKSLAQLEAEFSEFAQECFRAGYSLKTAWDLVQTDKPYPELVPILVKYLGEEGHSVKYREGVARALATSDSAGFFCDILLQFNTAGDQSKGVRWAIACALAQAAQDEDSLDTVERLLADKSFGRDRAPLVQAIKRMPKEQRTRVISSAVKDSDLKEDLKLHKIG
jgi:hypothetical protein